MLDTMAEVRSHLGAPPDQDEDDDSKPAVSHDSHMTVT